ncbi:hypothetical protein GPA22_21095 [Aromatoleum toluvorans]|uniref:Lipoprotein n=1 Tax=Aromatoleum toluvorans TaxID=92002 RepID=A0ABX1Q765_9RHOO|nr:hypothetical protein [Aromatoleum toluvorans]NMG46221.1 hypothetical protein [Aromatoleum toluvorans]
MRTALLLALVAVLASCATSAERAAQVEREVEQMITVYGPACERLGYKAENDQWRDCVLRLNAQQRYESYSRMPTSTTCIGHRGFFHCTTF